MTENLKSAIALADRAYHLDEKGLRAVKTAAGETADRATAAGESPAPEAEPFRACSRWRKPRPA
ncbi:MAG: hypothetical protein LBH21_08260 [Gracilibacteraceae bacterium]|nr:hypothetical protein [Gracilibacteraceae bacterium]